MTLAHRRELFLFVAWGIGVPWEAVSDGSRLLFDLNLEIVINKISAHVNQYRKNTPKC